MGFTVMSDGPVLVALTVLDDEPVLTVLDDELLSVVGFFGPK